VKIQPVVEGRGEVGAVPVLIRRLRDKAEAYELDVNPPIRKRRSELGEESQLRKAVQLALKQEECAGILIVLDSDDDSPAEKGPTIQAWAKDEAGDIPCAVVLAHREFEAWFLASIEALRGTRGIRNEAESHPDPEAPRDAKGQLEKRMAPRRSYSETADQPALTAKFDMAAAYRSCRSFRHVVRAFTDLAVAFGVALPNPWPPADWEVTEE
jgi:hypothetical protein